jgi:hypothetical protein
MDWKWQLERPLPSAPWYGVSEWKEIGYVLSFPPSIAHGGKPEPQTSLRLTPQTNHVPPLAD